MSFLMYNPLGAWNAWFALSSQAARVCWATQAAMLRGIAQAGAKGETETDRMVTENAGATEAQIASVVVYKSRLTKRRVSATGQSTSVPGLATTL